jgi:hypothetical protein
VNQPRPEREDRGPHRACLDRAKAAPCSSPSAIKCGQTPSTMPP